jgi:hypothetical protein
VSCVYRWKQNAFIDEILDDDDDDDDNDDNETSKCSSEEESSESDDYMQLLLPRTYDVRAVLMEMALLHMMTNRWEWEEC